MKYERTKEGYAEYLKSDHWKTLRKIVLKRDGCKCRECHKFGWQVHHKFYRDDWEDAQPEDCITLCRRCHKKEHGIVDKPKVVSIPIRIEEPTTKKQLMTARSKRLITKVQFKEIRGRLKASGLWYSGKGKKWSAPRKHRVKRSKWSKAIERINSWSAVRTYSKPRPHYVNRGTSSN